jgi:hypothetical protein
MAIAEFMARSNAFMVRAVLAITPASSLGCIVEVSVTV